MPAAMLLTRPSKTSRRKSASSGDGDVVADHAGAALALEPGRRRPGDGLLALRPRGREVGVGAQPPSHLELHAEPAGVLVAQVAHDLDESGPLDDLGRAGGVLLGEREEHRLLVAEVVEDRAARQAGLGLEHLDGGALVAVTGERPPGALEDLTATGGELLLGDLRHVRTVPSNRTSVLLGLGVSVPAALGALGRALAGREQGVALVLERRTVGRGRRGVVVDRTGVGVAVRVAVRVGFGRGSRQGSLARSRSLLRQGRRRRPTRPGQHDAARAAALPRPTRAAAAPGRAAAPPASAGRRCGGRPRRRAPAGRAAAAPAS